LADTDRTVSKLTPV